MPLSESTLKEIRAELVGLHQVQAQLTERIKALEAILTPFDFAQVGLPFQPPPADPTNDNGAGKAHLVVDSSAVIAFSAAATGLRASILEVLRREGPMRATAVAKRLEAHGFPAEGSSTPLPTRVYNDLWRMSERGVVTNENGMFSVR